MIIDTRKLVKTYKDGVEVTVLKGIDFQVKKGEFVGIMGRSGAGKSTLLYQVSLLDTPTSGEIYIDGKDTSGLSERERTFFRLNNLGFIFQDYALMPDLTALENVAVISLMQGKTKDKAYTLAKRALKRVGLGKRLDHVPSELSGGEQQRVSIARAIAHDPKIIFADEPTANLDLSNARNVMDILLSIHKHGQTILMITHERDVVQASERIITMEDGKIISQKKGKNKLMI